MELADLRSNIDMESLYVDFSLIRNALTVVQVAEDLKVSLSEMSKDGERRGTCPKCEKERSFSLNINTNRFNCFAKGCDLKGGGVIDFFAKLYAVSAKEASHLLAFIYGIQPYTPETAEVAAETAAVTGDRQPVAKPVAEDGIMPTGREVPESSSDTSDSSESESSEFEDTSQTAAYLIASIKHNLAQLEQLFISR